MKKIEAISIFGPKQIDLAKSIQVTNQAISQWPDVLGLEKIDRILGAAVRLEKPIPPELLERVRNNGASKNKNT